MKEQISKSLLETLTENGSDKVTTSELTIEDFERRIADIAMRSTEKRKHKMYCSKDFFEKGVSANGKRWLKHFLIAVDVTSNLEGVNYVRSLNLNEITEFPCGEKSDVFVNAGNSDANCHRKRFTKSIKLVTKTPSTCDGCVYNDTHNNH
tara:strand:- start:740 stop:1189 length:450 start_codon:yes stop_codon:yes gene_type:complete